MSEEIIKIKSSDLPLSCPSKTADLATAHPRVSLPLKNKDQVVVCPYCGAKYQLE